MKYGYIILCILVFNSCFSEHGNDCFRLYQYHDMEDSLQDYYTNNLKRISPGLACGDFKNKNDISCFKLLVDKRDGKVRKLIYRDLSNGNQLELYEFDPPENNVFIEKIYETRLRSSNVLPQNDEVILEAGQPALKLVFFGKSAVVFYWENGSFHKIWTAD